MSSKVASVISTPNAEPYVTLQQAAEHFAVSDKLLRRMIAAKQIPAYRIGGRVRGPIRLKISEIESSMYGMGSAA